MKRNLEVSEILAFINSFKLKGTPAEPEYCLRMITEKTNEDFLTQRAQIIKEAYKYDKDVRKAFKQLSSICNTEFMNCTGCPVMKYCNHFISLARKSVNESSFKIVDLFCGAGGLSLGFMQEGFVTSLANDIEPCCVDTYAHNHPETPRDHIILGDIKQIVENVGSLLKYKDVDVVIGGPPCQGFSEANRQRLIDDPRNQLYKNFVEVVEKIQPKFIVMENVKGMCKVKKQVIEDFAAIGYTTSAHVLNAKDYGVPQNRERLIYIGNRLGIDNEKIFEEIISSASSIPNFTLADAIFGLRKLKPFRIINATEIETKESGRKIEPKNSDKTNPYLELINQGKSYPATCNHKARYNNDRDIEIYSRLKPGDKSDDPKIADIMPYKSRNGIFRDKYFKLEPNKVCKTITAHMKFDCNMYIHPFQARGLTPREAARVQSYPDDYFFRGPYTKTYMQIGNSVPPLLGRALAKVIKHYIE